MDLTVNVKRDGNGNGMNHNEPDNHMNHNGPDNHMNQNGQVNHMSHNEQGFPMNNQGLCNSMNNVESYIGNSSLNYDSSLSSGPPNTMNNANVNQADGFWNSMNTGFNNGPERDDMVNNFASNNFNYSALNSYNNCWDSSNLLTDQLWLDQFNQNIPYCSGPPPTTNYYGDNNTSSAALVNNYSESIGDFQNFSLNMESSAGVNGSSNNQNIFSSNLPARETGIINLHQVSVLSVSVCRIN